ncbi:uncharacterized protein G2W53_041101 [Senna tora]|uniref:Uncharacterized protein n=1 Tax=Senna tora TaxID=362788 RepID=A0A834SGJ2_9FABA|nr:uncharacterized protein G2W53_041101 [Senna tora]
METTVEMVVGELRWWSRFWDRLNGLGVNCKRVMVVGKESGAVDRLQFGEVIERVNVVVRKVEEGWRFGNGWGYGFGDAKQRKVTGLGKREGEGWEWTVVGLLVGAMKDGKRRGKKGRRRPAWSRRTTVWSSWSRLRRWRFGGCGVLGYGEDYPKKVDLEVCVNNEKIAESVDGVESLVISSTLDVQGTKAIVPISLKDVIEDQLKILIPSNGDLVVEEE